MYSIDEKIDLSGVPCPLNSAKALLELELLEDGQILELTIDEGEPIMNVPSSLEIAGHKILDTIKNKNNTYRLLVRKGN